MFVISNYTFWTLKFGTNISSIMIHRVDILTDINVVKVCDCLPWQLTKGHVNITICFCYLHGTKFKYCIIDWFTRSRIMLLKNDKYYWLPILVATLIHSKCFIFAYQFPKALAQWQIFNSYKCSYQLPTCMYVCIVYTCMFEVWGFTPNQLVMHN